MVVSGGVVSTVNVTDAGVGSVFAAVSVDRTEKVCVPSSSRPDRYGDEQETYVSSSRAHSKVACASPDAKPITGRLSVVGSDGPPTIVVSGAAVSTVNA